MNQATPVIAVRVSDTTLHLKTPRQIQKDSAAGQRWEHFLDSRGKALRPGWDGHQWICLVGRAEEAAFVAQANEIHRQNEQDLLRSREAANGNDKAIANGNNKAIAFSLAPSGFGAESEPAKPEPAKPEPAKPEPAKPEPAKPEPEEPKDPTMGEADLLRLVCAQPGEALSYYVRAYGQVVSWHPPGEDSTTTKFYRETAKLAARLVGRGLLNHEPREGYYLGGALRYVWEVDVAGRQELLSREVEGAVLRRVWPSIDSIVTERAERQAEIDRISAALAELEQRRAALLSGAP